MNQTQSIIVYRNPAEAAFWEGGYFIPTAGGLVVGTLVFVALMGIAQKFSRRWQGPNNLAIGGAAIASICAGALAFHWLFI